MPTSVLSPRRSRIVESQQVEAKNISLYHRLVMFFTPRSQAASIQKGLEQVKAIREGKAQAKSFEEAIAEL